MPRPGPEQMITLKQAKRILLGSEYRELWQCLLEAQPATRRLSPREVKRKIKKGYDFVLRDYPRESVNPDSQDGSEEKALCKFEVRIPGRRIAVEDDGEKRMIVLVRKAKLLVYAKQ